MASELQSRSNSLPVLTVSQFTDVLKEIVEGAFPVVWVTGEISNFSRHNPSGHCYFTLKDADAQIRAVIWKSTAQRIRTELHDGLEVIVRGHLDVYAPRGEYKLIIEELQLKGLGALELKFRQLHQKLTAEGLFAPERKRPLPPFPRRIAFVTSPTGAALRDFLEVLRRRWPGVHVIIAPARVQGIGAAEEIAAAIERVNRLGVPIDVLVVGRGGGSLEDLWSFNEEVVVRAIHASRIPVVSAVGHEIDVTLADLVADVRALTPSEAAERIVPAMEAIYATLRDRQSRLAAALRSRTQEAQRRLETIETRPPFKKPFDRLYNLAQQLDGWQARCARSVGVLLDRTKQRTAGLAAHLESLSPLGVLARGYSLTTHTADGRPVFDASPLQPGETIHTRFARGAAVSRIEHIIDANGKG
ncbi:MAG TPA: exodeoxyribonuclease VII large subunit [Pirellulales bacterium]|nr:exodeoxyribonuclease VII large subunit [Pirellulales bacterium]